MSSNESLAEEVNTEDGTESFSEFEDIQWKNPSKTSTVTYSNEFEIDSQLSVQYSSDFESTAVSPTPKPTYSALTPRPRPKPRKSINTSLTRSYSDDFESGTQTLSGAGTPIPLDLQTARSGYSLTFTDDMGKYSRSPRKVVRARSLEILTARSAASLGYSDDFESVSKTRPTPRHSARYSTDTFAGYTESFELDSDSSEAQSVHSSETTEKSVWTPRTTTDEAVTVTERTISESDSSYTYTTTEPDTTYHDTPQMRRIADAARRQFLLHKLNVLSDTTVKKYIKPKQQGEKIPNKETGTFCLKKIRLLKKKLKAGINESKPPIEERKTPRHHYSEKDEVTVESLGINPSIINRLKTENSLGRMKKAANEEVHVPSECPSCVGQVTAMALREFAANKKTLLQSKDFDDRLSNNKYTYADPVVLAGQCAKDLPSYQEGSSEIFKRLLRPWNFKIWGSKILKEEEEKAEKERTTIVENTPRHNELKPTVKPLLVCPRLAGFSYKNHHMKESDHPSGLTPRNLYSPLFDDDKKGPVSSTGRTFEDKESSGLGVFDILSGLPQI